MTSTSQSSEAHTQSRPLGTPKEGQETGQLGGGGSIAPFSTRRGGIDDDGHTL